MKIEAVLSLVLCAAVASASSPIKNLEQPKYTEGELITHIAYSLVVNKKERQAAWVGYQLTREELKKVVERKDKFIADPLAPKAVALKEEYATPYDKGHLAPADHMLFSDTTMKESFFMTNMGPQYFSLNRGRWKTLESQSAVWAQKYGSVYIVAGPIFIATIDTIGNNLHVPSHYFKALLVYNDSIQQAIGFVMPNKKLEGQLPEYAVPIDSLEKLTGLDLFFRLPPKQQVEIERKINLKFWFN